MPPSCESFILPRLLTKWLANIYWGSVGLNFSSDIIRGPGFYHPYFSNFPAPNLGSEVFLPRLIYGVGIFEKDLVSYDDLGYQLILTTPLESIKYNKLV